MLISCGSCAIFVALPLAASSTLASLLSSCKLTLMPRGRVVRMIVTLSLAIVYSLVLPLLSGRPRSRLLLLVPVSRLSSMLWLLLYRRLSGSIDFCKILGCQLPLLLLFTVTALGLSRLSPIPPSHVGVDAHFTRCSIHDQTVSLHYLPTEVQVIDFFTKAQTREQHLLSKLKTIDPS